MSASGQGGGGPRLADLVRVYDEALDAEFCAHVVNLFETDPENHFRRPGQSTWTEYLITHRREPAWKAVERVFLKSMGDALADYARQPAARSLGRKFSRAFEHLKLKRYSASTGEGDHFPLHVDAFDARTAGRVLAFLWYLNDVHEGGETSFPALGLSIPARRGRLVVMPPVWMYEHRGEAPRSGDKFIVTSYLTCQDPEDAWRYSYPVR
jgi:hypothetical protein